MSKEWDTVLDSRRLVKWFFDLILSKSGILINAKYMLIASKLVKYSRKNSFSVFTTDLNSFSSLDTFLSNSFFSDFLLSD